MSGPYGGGDGGPPRRPAGARADQPPWDDSAWPQDQDTPGYATPGYAGPGYEGQGYGGQDYDGVPYGDRDYGQPAGRPASGPVPSFRPQGPASGAPQGYPRTGPRGPQGPGPGLDAQPPQRTPGPGPAPGPAWPGAGTRPGDGTTRPGAAPMPPTPSGYDQRGSGPRGVAGGYGDDYPPAGNDSFVPGFGGRDSFGGGDGFGAGRGQEHAGGDGGRGGPGPDPRGWEDQRRDRGNWDMRHDRPRRKATRWAPRILLLVVFGAILAGALTGGLYVYHRYEAKYHPADYAGAGTKPTVTVQVVSGETASGLAPTLVQLGVVASERAFTNAAEASTDPTGLEPGFFTLSHHMQASLAYAALLNPKNRVQLGVTIPEGKRVAQVIAILAKETRIPLKNFQQVIDHPAKLGLPSYAKGKVEGYLFPATYAIEPHETALEILQAMVARFNVEAAQVSLATAAARVGLTPTQVIIEASMAQAEGGAVSDYPKIARVIINRLKDGMHLQFDSVLLYGLHAYAINVTDKQIATDGPYNDFEHAGLPPGPISNPGDAAIQAILHPASGPWLYFLTSSGGKSTFSAVPLAGQ